MESQIPGELIFKGSSLHIFFDDVVQHNRTRGSVVIEGTRSGFLSLSNALIYYLNSLEEIIDVGSFRFVQSEIPFKIEIDESFEGIFFGKLIRDPSHEFVWKMSERELSVIASSIHSLGHINSEVHFDYEKQPDDLSVYCVVS